MKQEKSLARIMSRVFALSLIVFTCFALARAQASGMVIPSVCIEPNSQSGTLTLTADAPAGQSFVNINGTSPINVRVVINPGGANAETYAYAVQSGGTLSLRTPDGNGLSLGAAHSTGETVQWFTDAKANFGYNNTSNATVTLFPGIPQNFFSPRPSIYSNQPYIFLPGIHSNAISLDIPTRDGESVTWHLNGGPAKASKDSPRCATITYQGRLSTAGAAATGSYDMQFTLFDALTGGTAQSEQLTVTNVQVTNGVFTVALNLSSSLFNNNTARYLEIGVKPSANANVPFTILTPRQPITDVPFAVNAQNAQKAFDVQLILTVGAPLFADCSSATQYGQTRVDATNNKLYICTATGWKSTVLQ